MLAKYNNIKSEKMFEGVNRKILARGGSMMAVEASFAKGAIGPIHNHPHEQISYITKGKFEFEIDGTKQIVECNDSLYIESNAKHTVLCIEEGCILDIFTPKVFAVSSRILLPIIDTSAPKLTP